MRTSEERISDLEREVKSLKHSLEQTLSILQALGGSNRSFDDAVLALVVAHPAPDQLRPVLHNHLARLEADVVFQSNSEEHLNGVHIAQRTLMLALDKAEERSKGLLPGEVTAIV